MLFIGDHHAALWEMLGSTRPPPPCTLEGAEKLKGTSTLRRAALEAQICGRSSAFEIRIGGVRAPSPAAPLSPPFPLSLPVHVGNLSVAAVFAAGGSCFERRCVPWHLQGPAGS